MVSQLVEPRIALCQSKAINSILASLHYPPTALTYISHLIAIHAPTLTSSYLDALKDSDSTLPSMVTHYNLLSDPALKLETLAAALTHASTTGQISLLAPSLSSLSTTLSELGASPEQSRACYASVSTALPGEQGHDFRIKLLLTYPPGSSVDSSYLPIAKEALILALTDVKYSLPFSGLPCLDSLAPSCGAMVSLLKDCYAEGSYESYLSWKSSNPSVFAVLDEKTVDENARLMNLLSLCNEKSVLPYAEVAEGLKVPEGEVESWFLMAVKSTLVTGRMDQVARTVEVEGSKRRRFGEEGWKEIRDVLKGWEGEVDRVVKGQGK